MKYVNQRYRSYLIKLNAKNTVSICSAPDLNMCVLSAMRPLRSSALEPLPSEAIWSAMEGKVQQGKLSVETLRAVSGRVDKRIVIFVEDTFAKRWLCAILREQLGIDFDQIEIHAVSGDGNAKRIHLAHRQNPAIDSISFCFLDGDSQQAEDQSNGIFKLPGTQPEETIFGNVCEKLREDIAVLTVHCHRAPEAQQMVLDAIRKVQLTHRDPHLLFSKIGIEIGFVPEETVCGAFFSIWMRRNMELVNKIVTPIRDALKKNRESDCR